MKLTNEEIKSYEMVNEPTAVRTPTVIDQLEAQKAKITEDIKAAKHVVYMLDVDLKAVEKKIERTKEMLKVK